MGTVFLSSLFFSRIPVVANSFPTAIGDAEIVDRFEQAAQEHQWQVGELLGARSPNAAVLLPEIFPSASRAFTSAAEIVSALKSGSHEDATDYPQGTAVLFYAHHQRGEQGTLQAWLITENGIQAYSQTSISATALNDVVNAPREAINLGAFQVLRWPQPRSIELVWNNDVEVTIDEAIAELTTVLFPDTLRDALQDVDHLLVVPTQSLGTVPYALLQPFDEESHLIDHMSVSIAPSLFDINATVTPWDSEQVFSDPLIVGNPTFPESDSWSVPPLPGAEAEAESVGDIVNVTPLIGDRATKENVLSSASEASLLYFATHGVSDSLAPIAEGFLMFAAETLEQGWWTAEEIQNTQLQAQLAVLSACQTGLGGIHDAGVIGVSRAFQIAGVPRVVMSLWNVNDAATNELMQLFVRKLEHEIPAEALRQAIVELKETHPNPADWAAFTLFGTPR